MPIIWQLGIVGPVYKGCYVLGFLTIFIFNTFYGKQYGIKPKKALPFTVLSYIVIFAWSFVLAWIANGFEWGHHNAIRVYIWFPLVLFVFGKLFAVRLRDAMDYMAPSTCIVYAIARMGCTLTGCCYGVPFRFGIYSCMVEERCFPVQLCETITAALIAWYIIKYVKAHGPFQGGMLYANMLIVYGYSRFFWEFLADNEKVFLGISELAIHAFVCGTVGVLMYFFLKAYNRKNAAVKA